MWVWLLGRCSIAGDNQRAFRSWLPMQGSFAGGSRPNNHRFASDHRRWTRSFVGIVRDEGRLRRLSRVSWRVEQQERRRWNRRVGGHGRFRGTRPVAVHASVSFEMMWFRGICRQIVERGQTLHQGRFGQFLLLIGRDQMPIQRHRDDRFRRRIEPNFKRTLEHRIGHFTRLRFSS